MHLRLKLFILVKRSTCFGRSFRPSSGAQNCAERDEVSLCTARSTHAILRHAATPPHHKLRRNLTDCFNINVTLARLNCKLPDDGRRPKHVGVT
jgi:hypothetical protein